MKNLFLFLINILIINTYTFSQSPTINWQRCYGGSENDWGEKIIKGTNNDLIIVGSTHSSDGDMNVGYDSTNIYWFRLDTNNAIINSRGYGGSGNDYAEDVIPAWDYGYLILGSTSSNDFLVNGNHGNYDIWLFKITIQGVVQWQKSFGGSNADFAHSIIKTSDSCYVISGQTKSNDGDVSLNHGLPNTNDFWMIKIDASGNILWEKTYGGLNGEYAYHVIETKDKGFLLAGATFSNSGQVSGNHGAEDIWVVKTDSVGTFQWQHCYGGDFLEEGLKVLELNSHYYIFGGNSSNNGDVSNNHPENGSSHPASSDAWLLCIDTLGNLEWEKSYGGSHGESGWDIFNYGNYLFLISDSYSSDGDVSNNHYFSTDFWFMQTDLNGNIIWQSCYGGFDDEYPYSLLLNNNHLYGLGLAVSNDGDVLGNHGRSDFWLIDLNIDNLINNRTDLFPENNINISPNPVNDKLFITIHEEARMFLLDVNGKIVLEKKIINTFSENVSDIPNGIYFIKIILKTHEQYNQLIVVQH